MPSCSRITQVIASCRSTSTCIHVDVEHRGTALCGRARPNTRNRPARTSAQPGNLQFSGHAGLAGQRLLGWRVGHIPGGRVHAVPVIVGRLKGWRRVATRYDRYPVIFFSAVALAATVIFWLCSTSRDLNHAIVPRDPFLYCELRCGVARSQGGSRVSFSVADLLVAGLLGLACGSAWKRDPVSGVIGVEKGPLILVF